MNSKINLLANESNFLLRNLKPPTTGFNEIEILNSELEAFQQRNCLHAGICCLRCLKAHAITIAIALDLKSDVLEEIHSLLPYETGHNGYYLDEDQLISIENHAIS